MKRHEKNTKQSFLYIFGVNKSQIGDEKIRKKIYSLPK